eukprot:gb/GEZJ01006154.1/.p1 GENE.gb/GEZJ01006154.1/~~gb/GEZJ01006154.1/.p1  ORF type:complete len:100 (-),score=10.04 gb/GEZJ01006154.1/:342-641(-)
MKNRVVTNVYYKNNDEQSSLMFRSIIVSVLHVKALALMTSAQRVHIETCPLWYSASSWYILHDRENFDVESLNEHQAAKRLIFVQKQQQESAGMTAVRL